MTRRQCVEQVDAPSGCPECARLKERMGCLQREIDELRVKLMNAETVRECDLSLLENCQAQLQTYIDREESQKLELEYGKKLALAGDKFLDNLCPGRPPIIPYPGWLSA